MTTAELPMEKLDVRDAACDGIKAMLESGGHDVFIAYSEQLGLIYVDGVGPLYIVEIHCDPSL